MARGALIVIEGLDRAGKSTQVERLRDALAEQGHRVQSLRFPDRSTVTGKMIDAYLRGDAQLDDHAIHLLFSANRWEAAQSMRRALQEGTTLVVDRYSFSGAVYSAAKQAPLLDIYWAWAPEIGLPRPDLLIFLSLTASEQAARGGFGAERYETDEMQQRVRLKFAELLDAVKPQVPVATIDASLDLAGVSANVVSAATATLSSPGLETEIQSLGPLGRP